MSCGGCEAAAHTCGPGTANGERRTSYGRRMRAGQPILQYVDRPGLLDLGWGHPHPSLLPTDAWAAATTAALNTYGWQALTYGYEPGPGPAARMDRRPPERDRWRG